MEEELFDDLIQSLSEAVSYAQGDNTAGRSMIVSTIGLESETLCSTLNSAVQYSESRSLEAGQYEGNLLPVASS